MSETDIVYENGDYWVAREKDRYTVYQSGITHSVSDSAYAKSADGLTLAMARCDYKAKVRQVDHARRKGEVGMSEIKVTRCLGAALSDGDRLGWQVSYIKRQFDTKDEAQIEAERLRSRPTPAETKAISEGRFVDEELSKCALTSTESTL